jgi:hypothetical protein
MFAFCIGILLSGHHLKVWGGGGGGEKNKEAPKFKDGTK